MDYIRAWLRNLLVDLSILAVVCIVMLIIMKIFYHDALSLILLSGQFAIGMVNVLKLWPIVILAVIVYSMPRRRPRK
jgi:hypothetical protein